jgi:hypothetical protein
MAHDIRAEERVKARLDAAPPRLRIISASDFGGSQDRGGSGKATRLASQHVLRSDAPPVLRPSAASTGTRGSTQETTMS